MYKITPDLTTVSCSKTVNSLKVIWLVFLTGKLVWGSGVTTLQFQEGSSLSWPTGSTAFTVNTVITHTYSQTSVRNSYWGVQGQDQSMFSAHLRCVFKVIIITKSPVTLGSVLWPPWRHQVIIASVCVRLHPFLWGSWGHRAHTSCFWQENSHKISHKTAISGT